MTGGLRDGSVLAVGGWEEEEEPQRSGRWVGCNLSL
jgi:hypothetical protein